MALTLEKALDFLREHDFHLYHAKSWNESLLIHSFTAYSLVHHVLPFTQLYTEKDKELMRWAALLHDYGKTAANWQRVKRGRHKVSLGDMKYEELRSLLEAGIKRHSAALLSAADIEDILFIIEFHHGSGRTASTPERNRMKDVVSECDQAVSQPRISERLIRTINSIIDTVRYRLFTVEMIDHPIAPLVIGAFDYVLSETGKIKPLLYSATSTLYLGDVNTPIPSLDDVNLFLNSQIVQTRGTVRYDDSNSRIYTDERNFLELASDPERFVTETAGYANNYCARKQKFAQRNPDQWSAEREEIYLYGRVCGTTYNTLLDLCDVPKDTRERACLMAGGRHGPITVKSLEILGLRKRNASYEQTLLEIVKTLQPYVNKKLTSFSKEKSDQPGENLRYDVRDLLVPDMSVYPSAKPLNPKAEALRDYERYMKKEPLDVCPACHHFTQGNMTAAAFPQSPLGGTVEVFYTSYMRLVKKEGSEKRGVSFCEWCSKWWDLIATNAEVERHMYHFCVMPHHLFARLDWREILQPASAAELVELGSPGTLSGSGVYPHVAMLSLRGRDREALLKELVADQDRAEEQILDRLYKYGLRGSTIVTNPVSSRYLLTCGSTTIDTSEWPVLRRPLRLLNSARRTYTAAVRSLQQSPYAFGTFLATGAIPITAKTEKEVKEMVQDLAEKTGLSFLAEIWIGSKNRVENAGKVIRGMNETLRRLKGKEDDLSLIDAMVGKGLHLALSTRQGYFRSKENQPKEHAALRQTAEKLLKYKDQTYRRTELVRAMIYTLAYFSKQEIAPQASDEDGAVVRAVQANQGGSR